MVSKKYLPIVTPLMFSTFMSTLMSLIMPLLSTGNIPFPEVFISIGLAITVTFLGGILVPTGRWGVQIAQKWNLELGSLPFILVSSVPPSFFAATLMTLVNTLRRTGFNNALWQGYRTDIFMVTFLAYVITVLITPTVNKIVPTIASKD